MTKMINKMKVYCVVVTYNRKQLLLECISAILNQTFPVNRIILIDNASTDGTKETLRDNGYLQNDIVDYVLMEKNTGGSGGFYEGIKRAKAGDAEWVWIMDDDTIPSKTALERLIAAAEMISSETDKPIAYLASSIFGMNGEYMNVPTISQKKSDNGYPYWYHYLASGIVNIEAATFVSLLIHKAAITKCGLPCKDYFIWGDDFEYTQRLSKYYGEGYFVGDSAVIHKRFNAKALSLKAEDNAGRIDMFHYFIRNNAINDQYYGKKKHLRISAVKNIVFSPKYLSQPHGFKKMKSVIKGNFEFLVQYNQFRKKIDGEISK